jgi:hypothetical protein
MVFCYRHALGAIGANLRKEGIHAPLAQRPSDLPTGSIGRLHPLARWTNERFKSLRRPTLAGNLRIAFSIY